MATQIIVAPVRIWALASDGLENVLITTSDVVKVHVGTAAPAVDAPFHPLRANSPFSLAGVSGQKVYVQSAGPVAAEVQVTAV